MDNNESVVVTGVAPICCLGIGSEAYWTNLLDGKSGIQRYEKVIDEISESKYRNLSAPVAGYISDFSAKDFVQPRKNIKIMGRDVQLGLASGTMAIKQAQGESDKCLSEQLSPERVGIDLGTTLVMSTISDITDICNKALNCEGVDEPSKAASLHKHWGDMFMDNILPLWMLKYLPNMAACHIAITNNFQGPSNTIVLGDIGAMASIIEGARIIQRDVADAMVVGGTGDYIDDFNWIRFDWFGCSHNWDDPEGACRPFDAQRDGLVRAEAAGCLVLESESSAKKRGVEPLAKIRAWATCSEGANRYKIKGKSIQNCLKLAMQNAGIAPSDLSHINANGWGAIEEDAIEAQAIAQILPDVPVVAQKGGIGYAGSGSSAVEVIATVLSLKNGVLPPSRNYSQFDPACPIPVVHGSPQPSDKRFAIKLTFDRNGAASAIVFEKV